MNSSPPFDGGQLKIRGLDYVVKYEGCEWISNPNVDQWLVGRSRHSAGILIKRAEARRVA